MYIWAWQAPELQPDALISSRITLAVGEREACAPVLLRNEGGKPAVLGQRRHELLRVAVGLERAPVLTGEAGAELAHGRTDLVQLLRRREVQVSPRRARTGAAR